MSQFINDKTSTSVTNSVTIDGDGVMEGAYAEGRDVFGTVKPGTKGNMEAAKLCSAEDIARRKENEENGFILPIRFNLLMLLFLTLVH